MFSSNTAVVLILATSLIFQIKTTRTAISMYSADFTNACNKIKDNEFREICIQMDKAYRGLGIFASQNYSVSLYNRVKKSSYVGCPKFESLHPSQPDNLRSISPWTYVTNFDKSRQPSWILEAKCLCEGCLIPGGGEENIFMRSKAITVDVPVLKIKRKRSMEDCTTNYCMQRFIKVAVACHCEYFPPDFHLR